MTSFFTFYPHMLFWTIVPSSSFSA